MDVSQNGWFIIENSIEMDDNWGTPRKPMETRRTSHPKCGPIFQNEQPQFAKRHWKGRSAQLCSPAITARNHIKLEATERLQWNL